jgi:hypothetical protein
MENTDTVVAVLADHPAAETAVKKLTAAGFEMKNLSIVGKGYHTDEKVIGFYNAGDRIKFWGTRGAFWGGFWGLFLGGLFMAIPVVGHVVVLGYLAAIVVGGIENAVLVGGLSALGAALYSIGIPKDSVLQYETALKTDRFLVMAHGPAAEVARAKTILGTVNPSSLDVHKGVKNEGNSPRFSVGQSSPPSRARSGTAEPRAEPTCLRSQARAIKQLQKPRSKEHPAGIVSLGAKLTRRQQSY